MTSIQCYYLPLFVDLRGGGGEERFSELTHSKKLGNKQKKLSRVSAIVSPCLVRQAFSDAVAIQT